MSAIGPTFAPQRTVARRPSGKLMGSGWGNELTDAVNDSIGGGAVGPRDNDGRAVLFAYVTIGEAATGGGQYKGTFRAPEDLRVDTSQNVGATGEVTLTGDGSRCFVRNEAERGLATHRLTAGAGSAVPPLFGMFYGWATDGEGAAAVRLPVYTVHHIRTAACS